MKKALKTVKSDDIKPIQDLETVRLFVKNILTAPDGTGSILIMIAEGEETEYVLHLNQFEATQVAFALHGFSKSAHLPSMHQMYSQVMTDIGCELIQCTIEGVMGDVTYARMTWSDKNKRCFTNLCTVADAIIFSSVTEKPLRMIKRMLEDMNTLDDLNYGYARFEDWTDEDDDGDFESGIDSI